MYENIIFLIPASKSLEAPLLHADTEISLCGKGEKCIFLTSAKN
jgi:hypothetical protein